MRESDHRSMAISDHVQSDRSLLRDWSHTAINDDECDGGRCSPTNFLSNIAEQWRWHNDNIILQAQLISNRFSTSSSTAKPLSSLSEPTVPSNGNGNGDGNGDGDGDDDEPDESWTFVRSSLSEPTVPSNGDGNIDGDGDDDEPDESWISVRSSCTPPSPRSKSCLQGLNPLDNWYTREHGKEHECNESQSQSYPQSNPQSRLRLRTGLTEQRKERKTHGHQRHSKTIQSRHKHRHKHKHNNNNAAKDERRDTFAKKIMKLLQKKHTRAARESIPTKSIYNMRNGHIATARDLNRTHNNYNTAHSSGSTITTVTTTSSTKNGPQPSRTRTYSDTHSHKSTNSTNRSRKSSGQHPRKWFRRKQQAPRIASAPEERSPCRKSYGALHAARKGHGSTAPAGQSMARDCSSDRSVPRRTRDDATVDDFTLPPAVPSALPLPLPLPSSHKRACRSTLPIHRNVEDSYTRSTKDIRNAQNQQQTGPLLTVNTLNPGRLNRCLSSLSSDQSYYDIIKEATGILSKDYHCAKQQQQQQQHTLDGNTARTISSTPPDDRNLNQKDNGSNCTNDVNNVQVDNLQLSTKYSSDSYLFSPSLEEDLLLTISVKNRVKDIEHAIQSFDEEDGTNELSCVDPSPSIQPCIANPNSDTFTSRPPQCVFDFFHKPCTKHDTNKGERPPLVPVLSQIPHLPSLSSRQRFATGDSTSITSSFGSTEAEQLNRTLKVVFLGSGGNDNIISSLQKEPLHYEGPRPRRRSMTSTKVGVSVSVESWSPLDDGRNSMGGNISSSCSSSSSIDGIADLNLSLWEMEGLPKDYHHATQSLCFSPDSLYVIVYKVTPTTHNIDVCSCEDDFNAEEEAEQKSDRELHRHMDEHFFSWVDLLSKRAPDGCAILPVVSFDEDHNYGCGDDEASKRIRDRCAVLKKRILEEMDGKGGIVVDHHSDLDWNGSMSLPSSSSLKIVFHGGEIPTIFPNRSDGSMELRHALCGLASWDSVFHHHLHKEITPLISCVREIASTFRNDEYHVLPLDVLHVKVMDVFPEITGNELTDALKFLSSVGEIIFFTKEEDGIRGTEASSARSNQSVLSKFIILNPKWMAAVVSCFIRDDWKAIRKDLNETTHIRDSNFSILDGCSKSDRSNCPILSPKDAACIWNKKSFIKKAHDRISKLGSGDLFSFLIQVCEFCGIFVPFPIDETSSSVATITDPSAMRYLLPGLCQKIPEEFWTFKSKATMKTTLCQSWLLKNRVPCGMFHQVMITALEEIDGIVDANQHATNMNNTTTNVRVSQLLCWKTALYAKLVEEEDGNRNNRTIVEFFIHLVPSDSLQCPASHTLKRGMKLVVSAKGINTHDCDNIWRLGYRNILDSIESVVKKTFGVEVEREISCPVCMTNSDPCKASVWEVDNDSFYVQTDPTTCCNSGHKVSTKMIYGPGDDDTDAMTVCTACSCTSSSTASTCFREDNPGKNIEELLGAVVLVGLWDTNNERIMNVGTGFIADNSAGLILTAGHIFYDLQEGSKVGSKYRGHTNARAVIGTIHKSKEGDTAIFTYSAEIMTEDITNVDAVVLRITTKFENPMQCPSFNLKLQSDLPINHGKFKREKTKRLKLTKPHLEEQIRIIGFIQSGEGRYEQGQLISHTPSVAKGYVCNIKESACARLQYGPGIFSPRSEIVVECTSYVGQSGGPCVNQDGKVIGIVCRTHPNEQRRCYLAPASQLEKILKKAKKRIATK